MTLPCPTPSCDRVMPGNLRVCRACSARLIRDLDDVPDLATHLDIAITRQARIGEPGAGHTEPTDPAENEVALTIRKAPLPWDPRVREAADVLKSTLVGWKRVLSDGAPLVSGPLCSDCEHPSCEWTDLGRKVPDTLTGLSRWLVRHRVRLLRHPAVPEAVDELGDAVRQARRAIDRPPDRIYAGPCEKCGQDLLALPGRSTVICRHCDLEYQIEACQTWMRGQLEDQLAHSAAMSGMLHQLGIEVAASTIRYWAQEHRLLARGADPHGRPLYRVGDVLELDRQRRVARESHHQ